MPGLKTTEAALVRVTQRRRNAALYLDRHTGYFSDIEMARRSPEIFKTYLAELLPEIEEQLREEEEKKEEGEEQRRSRVGLPISATFRLYSIPESSLPRRRRSSRDAHGGDGRSRVRERSDQIHRSILERSDTVSFTIPNMTGERDVDLRNGWYVQDGTEHWRPPLHRDTEQALREYLPHIERRIRLEPLARRATAGSRGARDSVNDESEEETVVEYVSQTRRRQSLLSVMQARFSEGLDEDYFDYGCVDYNRFFDDDGSRI